MMSTKNRKRVGKLPINTTTAPAAVSTKVLSRAPEVVSRNGRSIIKAHEQIATVSGSVGFSTTKYYVNPGLGIYTWLSGQAAGWEKHRIRKFQVVYIPAEAVTTTAGSVYLAFDYDPMDAAPASLASLSTYETQANGRVYEKVSLDMNCGRAYDGVQAKKIRNGPVGSDLQLYDAATFSFSTISCANTNALGQLWVYYEVELISQQSEPTIKVNPSLSVFNTSAPQSFATGVAENVDFDEEITNGLDITNVFGVYSLAPGSYMIFGEIGVYDNTGESFSAVASLLIDGSATTPPQLAYGTQKSAGNISVVPYTFYVTTLTNTNFSVSLTLSGAAGSLATNTDACRLFVKAL